MCAGGERREGKVAEGGHDGRVEDEGWRHARGPGANGVNLHYVRRGGGDPVVLLHGWPGFWYDWRRVLFPLSEARKLRAGRAGRAVRFHRDDLDAVGNKCR